MGHVELVLDGIMVSRVERDHAEKAAYHYTKESAQSGPRSSTVKMLEISHNSVRG